LPFLLLRLPFLLAVVAVLTACSSRIPEDSYALDTGFEQAADNPLANPDLDGWIQRFETDGREIYRKRREIVDACRLRPGEVVADIGAGTGLFSTLLAEAVGPSGRVYAVDIVPLFLRHINDRAREAGFKNVEARFCTRTSIMLPEASVDFGFLCDVYRHFDHPRSSMASVHAALRPGGRLVVIDFSTLPGVSAQWVLEQVRTEKQELIAQIEGSGFKFMGEEELLDESWFLTFERIDRDGASRAGN